MRMASLSLSIAAIAMAQTNPPLPAPGTVTIPVAEYNALVDQAESVPLSKPSLKSTSDTVM